MTSGGLDTRLPDPDDAPFLEAAIGGGAEYLVTGDKVHYPLRFSADVKILSPTEFLNFLHKRKDGTEPRP